MPSAALSATKRVDVPLVEEASELEELEQFAKAFKQRRIKLGFTQVPRAHVLFICDGVMMLLNFIMTSVFIYVHLPGRRWLGHGKAVRE